MKTSRYTDSQIMAILKQAVAIKRTNIRLACAAFGISETCYRYQPKLDSENAEIADWVLLLTNKESGWVLVCALNTCVTWKAFAGIINGCIGLTVSCR